MRRSQDPADRRMPVAVLGREQKPMKDLLRSRSRTESRARGGALYCVSAAAGRLRRIMPMSSQADRRIEQAEEQGLTVPASGVPPARGGAGLTFRTMRSA